MQTSKRILKAVKNADVVIEGVYNFQFPTNCIEEKAKERAKTCLDCEHYFDEDIESLQVIDRIESLTKKMCNLCGCVLSYKLRTSKIETKNCPLNEN